jgi:hypothetical protein
MDGQSQNAKVNGEEHENQVRYSHNARKAWGIQGADVFLQHMLLNIRKDTNSTERQIRGKLGVSVPGEKGGTRLVYDQEKESLGTSRD